MIPVTKPYFPNRQKLDEYIDGIYERQWLTNNGRLVQELTKRLEDYLGVENLRNSVQWYVGPANCLPRSRC